MINDSSLQAWFHQKSGVLATMHRKEQAIAPILKHHLGIEVVVPLGLNTDEFGTFTRDIKRPGDQLNAAQLKAEKALALTGLTLAFASEGSFGPHPSLPLLISDHEIVLMRDRDQGIEVIGQALSTTTNYGHQYVTTLEAALAFAQKIGFSDHGLVAMSDAEQIQSSQIFKGVTRESELVEIVTWLLKKFGQAYLETDMRAMHNPTRMKVIAEATQNLIHNLSQRCPQCGCPGYTAVEHKTGLPCALCGFPTDLKLASTHRCQKCDFSQLMYFPNGQEFADPAQCLYCNP
ncbi:DUF6671 family protein [Neosynechococcus sphagnicola]|uniref:DUF6671 family protein n=1 Tax=Neosynechococcus sphagnicola TaxID=1501145 RepID=UPI00056D4A45|nr:DUF6671 family protein [Neosynechococcus sphagnicola]